MHFHLCGLIVDTFFVFISPKVQQRLRSCEVILSDMLPTRVVSVQGQTPLFLNFAVRLHA